MNQGKEAEASARRYLQQQGLKLICSNFRCKMGEVDLVMFDGRVLVFVEVRSRSNPRFANAAQSVDWRKQKRLGLTANAFLRRQQQYQHYPCRFDVIAYDRGDSTWDSPRWIKRAFEPPTS